MADTADDDLWGTLGAQPAAPAAQPATGSQPPASAADDPVWSTLGAKGATTTGTPETSAADPNRIHFDPDRLRIIGNALLRGAHQGLDVPAEALAGGADWVARQFGYNTNQQAQTKAGDVAFNQPYDVNPENQGIGPGAARLAGNLAVTLGPAMRAGNLATAGVRYGTDLVSSIAGAAEPYVANALRYIPGLAGGAAAGATVAAQTGEDVRRGAALGGLMGAAVPFAADTGNALLASRNPAVIKAATPAPEGHGIPLRYGQVADSRIIRYLDDITAPESSNAAQRTAVTTDAARSMGITPEFAAANDLPAGQITPKVMQAAQKLNGGVMNDVESSTTIQGQPALNLATNMRNIAADAAKTPSAFDDVKAHIKDVIDSIDRNSGVLPGKVYGDLVAHGTPLDVALNADNSVVRTYAGRIKEALQDAMEASATPENAARYAQARLQYKNMMTLAPLVNKGIPGQISPLLLQGAANRSFTGNAFRGAGQLGSLGDVSQQFLKPPPQSGTEPREFVRDLIQGNLLGLLKSGYFKVTGNALQSVLGRNPVNPLGVPSPSAMNTAIPSALILRNQLQNPPPP
jgi:hypothetical protein